MSAKTGLNVEKLFTNISIEIMDKFYEEEHSMNMLSKSIKLRSN